MAGLFDLGCLLTGRRVWCSFGVGSLPSLFSYLESELLTSTLEVFGPFFLSGDGLSLLLFHFLGVALAGPLSDTVSFRLSASDNSADGYATNITTGENVNSRDRSAIRGQLLIEPSEDLSIRIIADYNEIDEICCAASSLVYGAAAGVASALAGARGFATAPVDPWARNLTMNESPSNKLEGKGLSVQFDYDLGYATLTSISSVREQSLKSTFDADFSAALLVDENRVDYDFETFTQELRLTSNGEGDLQWMVGAFHSDEDVATFIVLGDFLII